MEAFFLPLAVAGELLFGAELGRAAGLGPIRGLSSQARARGVPKPLQFVYSRLYCTPGRTVRSVSPTALYYVELGEKWRGFESPSALAGISRARSGTEAQSAWVPLIEEAYLGTSIPCVARVDRPGLLRSSGASCRVLLGTKRYVRSARSFLSRPLLRPSQGARDSLAIEQHLKHRKVRIENVRGLVITRPLWT